MRSAAVCLLAGVLGCGDGGGFVPRTDGGTSDGQTLHDAGTSHDMAGLTCASIKCGANATCDPKTLTCSCNQGFGGDPQKGCTALPPCGNCPQFSHCDTKSNTCACEPGYQLMNNACAVAPIVDPSTRSANDVCAMWAAGHIVTDANPWQGGSIQTCTPGTLSRGGIDDTLRRADLFRWLIGLYPIVDDAGWNSKDQECAVMEAANGQLNHMPPNTWTCWTQNAYDASSSSNIAEGVGNGADSIDLYMDDGGVPSLGHRRWVSFPPLDGVGIGYASAFSCFHVFGQGNMSVASTWQAVPNPGPTPSQVAMFTTWSFHGDNVDFTNATVSVTRKDDNMPLAVEPVQLPAGYGVNAIGWTHMTWGPQTGKTYTVQIGGTSLGAVSYDVQPVSCP